VIRIGYGFDLNFIIFTYIRDYRFECDQDICAMYALRSKKSVSFLFNTYFWAGMCYSFLEKTLKSHRSSVI